MEIHTNHRIDNIKNGLEYTSRMIKTTASELIRISQYVNQSSHRLLIMRTEVDAYVITIICFSLYPLHSVIIWTSYYR